MFRGSLPAQAQSIVYEIIKGWDTQNIYIGCSGNFTIERAIFDLKRAIHSNDVTMYSCTLGRYFSGQPLSVGLNPEYAEEYGYLESGLKEGPAGIVATIMLCTKLLETFGKKNEYYQRLANGYKNQWPKLLEKTQKKIADGSFSISNFFAGDVVNWSSETDEDAGFVCFPPFFAADYEKMNAALDAVFDWQKPEYDLMDEARRELLFARIQSKKFWMLGTHVKHEELSEHLHGICQTTNRGVPIYLYTNHGPKRRVGPNQICEHVTIPRLNIGHEIGSKLSLVKLNGQQFQALRSQYMNAGIKPGQPTIAVGVLVDGILVGCYAFSLPNGAININFKYTPHVYLLSDFAVAPTDYSRLSKLVLYAALSKESKMMAERMIGKRVKGIVTTAFAKNPVSMKYRGLFDLTSRKETKEKKGTISDEYYAQKYQLNYCAIMGKWTLEEGIAEWKKKFGKSTPRS